MSTRLAGARPTGMRLGSCFGAWALIVLFQFACATGTPRGSFVGYRNDSLTPPPGSKERAAVTEEPGLESATEYVVDFMEPGTVATRPVPIARAEFQQAVLRLSRDVRLKQKTPRQAAHELLSLSGTPPDDSRVAATGDWKLEAYAGQGYTWIPERQEGPVALTPQAEQTLKEKCRRQRRSDGI